MEMAKDEEQILDQTPLDLLPNKDSWFYFLDPSSKWKIYSRVCLGRREYPVQNWYSVVWFDKHVPRWAFILWLLSSINSILLIDYWVGNVDDDCSLRRGEESHKHLLFCPFSRLVWQMVWSKTGISTGTWQLNENVDWFVNNVQGKGLRSIALRCSSAAAVYRIWRERNQRIFAAATVDQISSSTITSIMKFLSSSRLVKPSHLYSLGITRFCAKIRLTVASCFVRLQLSFESAGLYFGLFLSPWFCCYLDPMVSCFAWLVDRIGLFLRYYSCLPQGL